MATYKIDGFKPVDLAPIGATLLAAPTNHFFFEESPLCQTNRVFKAVLDQDLGALEKLGAQKVRLSCKDFQVLLFWAQNVENGPLVATLTRCFSPQPLSARIMLRHLPRRRPYRERFAPLKPAVGA